MAYCDVHQRARPRVCSLSLNYQPGEQRAPADDEDERCGEMLSTPVHSMQSSDITLGGAKGFAKIILRGIWRGRGKFKSFRASCCLICFDYHRYLILSKATCCLLLYFMQYLKLITTSLFI